MDRKQFIDEYLAGKRPLHSDKWTLPTEEELDRDEAIFDAIVARKGNSPRQTRRHTGRLLAAAAAILIAAMLFLWKSQTPQDFVKQEEPTATLVEQQTITADTLKRRTREFQTPHAEMANAARGDRQRRTRHRDALPQPIETASPKTAADSLNYYLTQLEERMGHCSDDDCMAQMSELIEADERIKRLLGTIIHQQVETASVQEMLIDTTENIIIL